MIESTFYPEPGDLGGPVPIPQADGNEPVEDRSDELLDDLTMLDDQDSAPEGVSLARQIERIEQRRDETYQWVEDMGSVGVAV